MIVLKKTVPGTVEVLWK